MKKIFFLLLVSLLMFGYSQVPVSISHPWNRTLSNVQVVPGSKISIIVKNLDSPLLGSSDIEINKVFQKAKDLLERRGFIVTSSSADYSMSILYRTEKNPKSTSISSSDSRAFSFGGSSSYGTGVYLARTLSALFASSSTSTQQTIKVDQTFYLHAFACELTSIDGSKVWKYDSIVENEDIDFLSLSTSVLQSAFSSLPTTQDIIPRVSKIKSDRFDDFAKLYLTNKYLICPALPSYIKFDTISKYTQNGLIETVKNVNNVEATLAYIDLIQTAEYAIPAGYKKELKDPTDVKIWSSASLIGKYYIGNDNKAVNVLIELSGSQNCYKVVKARLLTDNDYRTYQANYINWVNMLNSYYNFYE